MRRTEGPGPGGSATATTANAHANRTLPRRSGGIARYSTGRVCYWIGCTTRLSVYNADLYCWLHQQPAPQPGSALRA
jgi:hypothetical protein